MVKSVHTQRLLLEKQEDGVKQFDVFGQVVQLGSGISFQDK